MKEISEEKIHKYGFAFVFMESGVHLKQGFGATGYAEDIRFTTDFSSRMYFMEEITEESVIEDV